MSMKPIFQRQRQKRASLLNKGGEGKVVVLVGLEPGLAKEHPRIAIRAKDVQTATPKVWKRKVPGDEEVHAIVEVEGLEDLDGVDDAIGCPRELSDAHSRQVQLEACLFALPSH